MPILFAHLGWHRAAEKKSPLLSIHPDAILDTDSLHALRREALVRLARPLLIHYYNVQVHVARCTGQLNTSHPDQRSVGSVECIVERLNGPLAKVPARNTPVLWYLLVEGGVLVLGLMEVSSAVVGNSVRRVCERSMFESVRKLPGHVR